MKEYNHKKIEQKWQVYWDKKKVYSASNKSKKKKFYSLIEFPYPSGEGLHVGHPRPYIGMDIISRKRRMEGFNVLYPIGWDAFGLPTENYAIKTGKDPRVVTKQNTDNFRRQIKSLGISFDWSREINTTDPKYYKWTQWIFLQFLKEGLAYKAKMNINWCPKCKTGLANEEVVAGNCERCGTAVEKREKEQWMLAITKYADRLDKDLDEVDYMEKIKIQQRNWIGKSNGAEIEFKISLPPTPSEGRGEYRFQTADPKLYAKLQEKAVEMRNNGTNAEKLLWEKLRKNNVGCHFRQQHIIDKFIVDFLCLSKKLVIEIDGDIHDYQKERDQERTDILKALKFKILRFDNNQVLENTDEVISRIKQELEALPLGEGLGGASESIKVFTTRPDTIFGATYMVLAPEHELVKELKSQISNWIEVEKYINETKNKNEIERTTEDKDKTGVELIGVKAINPANGEKIPIWIADYVLVNYGTGAIMAVPADDIRDKEFALKFGLPIIEDYKKAQFEDYGKIVTKYKLRDWIFSRQRYWGEPIPVVHCDKCGIVPVPEKDLPVFLPKVKNYQPTDSGESPLANISSWVNTKCPKCKGEARRETDTMPNWAGSSWYYLRYADPKNNKEFASKKNLEYWLGSPKQGGGGTGGVDWYNGGMEHTTLHLLYSRFWHKFLYDLKLVPGKEPYMKRTSHGLILGEGGVKMSKSLGNVVNPNEIVKTFGADTLRLYTMFMGPFEEHVAWSEDAIIGPRRFLEKVWRIAKKVLEKKNFSGQNSSVLKLLNKTIKKVSLDIEEMRFNTAISALMILSTEMESAVARGYGVTREDYKKFLQILSPFAPHITEELWSMLGEKKSINLSPWPSWDESLMKDEQMKIVVQVNGKVRAEIMINADETEEEVKKKTLTNAVILKHTEGKEVKKIIYVKGRLVNVVI